MRSLRTKIASLRLSSTASHIAPVIKSKTMPMPDPLSTYSDPATLRSLRSEFTNTIKDYASNPSETFRVVHTCTSTNSSPSNPNLKTLYVLDSSFNPPTRAHFTIARNAVLGDTSRKPGPVRLMLLLATENADKKAKPAQFEDRLVMMSVMADSLRRSLLSHADQYGIGSGGGDATSGNAGANEIAVDVAITKKPFYMDKAMSIDESKVHAEGVQQVHVTGYDTIIRIFDAKYYPKDRGLRVLEPFLGRHRLRVCYRVGVGEKEKVKGGDDRREQEKYVEAIGDGRREAEGMNRKWRGMIELVDDAKSVEGVSSTEARRCAGQGKKDELEGIVGGTVAEYILSEKLYEDAESVKKSYS